MGRVGSTTRWGAETGSSADSSGASSGASGSACSGSWETGSSGIRPGIEVSGWSWGSCATVVRCSGGSWGAVAAAPQAVSSRQKASSRGIIRLIAGTFLSSFFSIIRDGPGKVRTKRIQKEQKK